MGRNEVVPEPGTFVGGAPQFAAGGIDGKPDAIPDTGGEHSAVFAVGIEDGNGGTDGLAAPRGPQSLPGFPIFDLARAHPAHAFRVVPPGPAPAPPLHPLAPK